MPGLKWGSYNIAIPDFSGISKDVQQAALQVQEYQRQRAQQKQQRKDIMWRQFMQETDIKTPEFNNEQLQEIKSGVTEGYRRKLQDITKEADETGDGVLSWDQIARARRVKNKTQSTLNQLDESYQQWLTEIELAKDPDKEFEPESVKRVLKWDFSENPIYEPQLQPKQESLSDVIYQEADEFKGGGVSTAKVEYESNGTISTDEVEYLHRYYDATEKGGLKTLQPKVREQMDVLRNQVINRHKGAVRKDWDSLDKTQKEKYNQMADRMDGVATGYEAMVYDKAQPAFFPYEKSEFTKPAKDDKEDSGGLTGKQKAIISPEYAKPHETPAFDSNKTQYWGVAGLDENITADQSINNPIVVDNKGKVETVDGSKSFNNAQIVGYMETDSGSYAHMRAKRGEKQVKSATGKKVFYDKTNDVTGTRDEIIKKYMKENTASDLSKKEKKNQAVRTFETMRNSGNIEPKYKDQQTIDVYAPISNDNPELGSVFKFAEGEEPKKEQW